MIKQIAESLLGRALTQNDGITPTLLTQVETGLQIKLPTVLREFHLLIGNTPMFTSSFQRFLPLPEIEIQKNLLVFMEENQGVCYWGIKSEEISAEEATIYQRQVFDEDVEDYSEEITLLDFIQDILYYQCAQGGYEFGGCFTIDGAEDLEDFRNEIAEDYTLVVKQNGLIIYQKGTNLIWYLTDREGNVSDDMIFLSSLTKEGFEEEADVYGFNEL